VKSQMRLKPGMNCLGIYEEAVGTLTGLTVDQGFLIAQISKVSLVLPHEMEDKLRPIIGKRVGILHTDIPGKEYLIRVIPESGVKTAIRVNIPQESATGSV
jgi:hypothetical protein